MSALGKSRTSVFSHEVNIAEASPCENRNYQTQVLLTTCLVSWKIRKPERIMERLERGKIAHSWSLQSEDAEDDSSLKASSGLCKESS